MKYFLLSILTLCLSLVSQAQNYHTAKVATTTEGGYTKILLSQELIGLSERLDFSDIRIKDSNGAEVPYFVRSENYVQRSSQSFNYTLVENSVKDSISIVVIDNKEKEDIARFNLVVRSAEVNKYVRLRGSNDRRQWYIVKQREKVQASINRKDANNETLSLSFPQGNYRYYEVELTNDQNSPLEILYVEADRQSTAFGALEEIHLGAFVQKDSTNKVSYISYPHLKYNYRISKIAFEVDNKANYLRSGQITTGYDSKSFNLSSKGANEVLLEGMRFSNKSVISINNQDNPPLDITGINAFGQYSFLYAYLSEGENYLVVVGEHRQVARPKYDIQNFQNEISTDVPSLRTSDLTEVEVKIAPKAERKQMWIEKPIVLWSIIVVVGLLLALVCFRTMKEIKSKKDDKK